jgi:dihydrofolate synthase/folylpolyglutamate synthase
VAGTNGKGSLLAYLNEIFAVAGYKVHRYISPQLVRFNERIQLGGQTISDDTLKDVLERTQKRIKEQPVTSFESTTAAAFLAFSEHKADVLLLETGMGGRLDATNVVESPILTAITPIAFDHQEFLGGTLAAIAGEKAGIMKRGVPCVVGRQPVEALDVLNLRAEELQVPLYRMDREWQVIRHNGGATYESPERTLDFQPSLAGDFQFDNAATAIACIDRLPQFSVTDAQIRQGLQQATWPARLQPLKTGRLAAILPKGMELWLDGGHNPQGGQVLADWLQKRGMPEVYLVCGMLKTKDSVAYLRPMAPYVKQLYAIAIPEEKLGRPAEALQQAAEQAGINAVCAASMEKALQTIAQHAKTPSIVCICGSLSLAGKALAANGT